MNKNIRKVFQRAAEADAVLFFDEADSVLGKRLSAVTQSADHGVNMARSVMLLELDRFAGVVIFATNFVRNYDQAFARRLLHHVGFELPDQPSRLRLFHGHMPPELPMDPTVEVEALARITDGFNGGEIRNVVLKAAAKAAATPGPDTEKRLTDAHFREAIGEVLAARNAILGSPTGENWMADKLRGVVERTKTPGEGA